MFDRGSIVVVLLWKNLAVVYGLDSGVIMILVDLSVDRTCDVLMLSAGDLLVYHSWGDLLVDCGVVLARLAAGLR